MKHQHDKEEDSRSSTERHVVFSEVVEEIYAQDSTSYLYEDDTELDLIDLFNEPTAYDFGDGLQAYRDLSDYEDLREESSVSEGSSNANESAVIREMTVAREVDEEDDYVGNRDGPAPSFIMSCFNGLPMLFWCFRGFSMLGQIFTPASPIVEDDIVAVGMAKGVGGGCASTGVAVVP